MILSVLNYQEVMIVKLNIFERYDFLPDKDKKMIGKQYYKIKDFIQHYVCVLRDKYKDIKVNIDVYKSGFFEICFSSNCVSYRLVYMFDHENDKNVFYLFEFNSNAEKPMNYSEAIEVIDFANFIECRCKRIIKEVEKEVEEEYNEN